MLLEKKPTEGGGGVSPLREVWRIAWPTVLAMTSYTVMSFIDGLMVAQLGPVEFAAQSIGVMWSFSLTAIALGVLTVVNTYVSQNLGAGRAREGARYAWASQWMAAGIWVVVMVPYGLAIPWIFRSVLPGLFPEAMKNHGPEMIAWESEYAAILIFGSIFLMASRGINQYFFGMHRPGIVTVGALVGNATNLVGNYVLIYGEEGLPALGLPGVPGVPKLGIGGAAIATVVGSAVEWLIPFWVFVGRRMNEEFATRAAWRPAWKPVRELVKIGWPGGLQWGAELWCWAVFMVVLVAGFGTEHAAACAAAFAYMRLSFMPALGFSVATNSLVGKYIGANRPEVAVARARLSLKIAMGWMTVCAVVFIVLRDPLMRVYAAHGGVEGNPEEIVRIGSRLMILMALFQTADAVGVVYSGALRGAGDTVWPGVMTLVLSWGVMVGGGFAAVKYFGELESLGPWMAAAVYIVMYGVIMGVRFERGKWRNIRLLEERTAESMPMAGVAAEEPTPIAK